MHDYQFVNIVKTYKGIPYLLAYKTPPSGASLQNLYGAQTIYHSKSLCYKTPPERGHLCRTGHIGGSYMPVDTVSKTWLNAAIYQLANQWLFKAHQRSVTLAIGHFLGLS